MRRRAQQKLAMDFKASNKQTSVQYSALISCEEFGLVEWREGNLKTQMQSSPTGVNSDVHES